MLMQAIAVEDILCNKVVSKIYYPAGLKNNALGVWVAQYCCAYSHSRLNHTSAIHRITRVYYVLSRGIWLLNAFQINDAVYPSFRAECTTCNTLIILLFF